MTEMILHFPYEGASWGQIMQLTLEVANNTKIC